MVMNIHSNASYLSETNSRSRSCGHFFMGWMPKNDESIQLNGAFYVNMTILRFVVASAAEAELGALFHNCQDGIIFRQTLEDLGHTQPRTPVYCDNATAVGIATNTLKQHRSRSMEMRFFWVGNKEAQNIYGISWHPGQENLPDYQSKHHTGAHHRNVRPWYLHQENSPRFLPRAIAPSTLKGCVGTLKEGYIREFHEYRVLVSQLLYRTHNILIPITHRYIGVPTWSDLTRSLSGFGRRTLDSYLFSLFS
jgi:hypothetical protein